MRKVSNRTLSRLGFVKNGVVETIVSTYCADGSPNAAPMGVTYEDPCTLIIRPYTSTLTYRNIVLRHCATINLTTNAALFFKTTFKNIDGTPSRWFDEAETIDAPRIRDADTSLEVKEKQMETEDPERAKILCDIVNIRLQKVFSTAYSRAKFAVIESLIHATRVQVFATKGDQEHVQRLVQLIKHYQSVVQRVAPRTQYSKMMGEIVRRVRD